MRCAMTFGERGKADKPHFPFSTDMPKRTLKSHKDMLKLTHLAAIAAALLTTLPMTAQTYKDVLPGADSKQLRASLAKHGARYAETVGNEIIMTDRLANIPCSLAFPRRIEDRGAYIDVILPNRDTWTELLGDFKTVETLLTKTHGEPTDKRRLFTNAPYRKITNNVDELLGGFLFYDDTWEFPQGRITLTLWPDVDTALVRNKIIYETF